VIDIPADAIAEERDALYAMLERLSDHDDALVEALLEEVKPPRDRVFEDLARELREGLVVPVFAGAARRGHGAFRLMKALRHETPATEAAVKRLGVESTGDPLALIVKTLHTAHAGKLSVARVLRGPIKDGALLMTAAGERVRISGLFQMIGQTSLKIAEAPAGAAVAFGRLNGASTGETVSAGKSVEPVLLPDRPAPVMAEAIQAHERKDDVKLSAALAKLADEDCGLILETNAELGETILHGQGPLHLRIAVEKLASRFGVAVDVRPPRIAYRETIRGAAAGVRGRHRKQSGGHGQFGDVVIDVAPLPPGSGITFIDKVTGGAIPRQYIASVEEGIRAALKTGPLGFPVVDLSVALIDGSYHTVDSSDMAFQMAGRLAIIEALSRCHAVLLEPIDSVEFFAPSSATAKITALVSSRRGQILGFDRRPGWEDWDVLRALMPEAGMGGMIIELRSISSGVATYRAAPSHFAELIGRDAELVLAAKRAHA
jgi:elongation factor G